MAEDKVNDSTLQEDSFADDQPDNIMDVSGAEAGDEEQQQDELSNNEQVEGKGSHVSSKDLSQFETAPTHRRIYPSLSPMDTQLSFLTPSSQPSAPPPDNTTKKPSPSSKKLTEQNEVSSGRDSPRISALLALRSSRSGAKKPNGTPPPSSASSASASSSRTASSIVESLQRGKKRDDSGCVKKAPVEPLPSKSTTTSSSSSSSSKRKPSSKNVRHSLPTTTTNKSNPPSPPSEGTTHRSVTRNGNKTSPELDFETAPEGTGEGKSGEQASDGSGSKSEVIIRTNTHTHLGTKRKSTGAFGTSSSTDSSENWQTAHVGDSGDGSSSPPMEESPSKRLRSSAVPSVPSLRRALGGSSSSSSTVSKGGEGISVAKTGSSQGHSRSLGIGSGLAAILSRPVSGKLKSPTNVQKQQAPVIKKESSHSWISQLFHKS